MALVEQSHIIPYAQASQRLPFRGYSTVFLLDRVLNNSIPLENSFSLVHRYRMLLPKPDPYEKARRIILFLGAASLVMGVAKLFGAKDNTGDKNQ